MSVSRSAMQKMLVARYDEIAARLTSRLGSSDLAADALQDTYLRLERGDDLGDVRNPVEYLFRIALNVARDRKRSDGRRASREAIDAILDLADDMPDPARIVEGRSEFLALERALEGLPQRRREIFLAAWGDGLPHREIADRHGLSVRMIDMELAKAREYCAGRLKRSTVIRFRPGSRESSDD